MRRLDPDYDKGRFGTSQLGLPAVERARAHDGSAGASAIRAEAWCCTSVAASSSGVPDRSARHSRLVHLDYPAVVDFGSSSSRRASTAVDRFLPTDLAWLQRIPPRPSGPFDRRGGAALDRVEPQAAANSSSTHSPSAKSDSTRCRSRLGASRRWEPLGAGTTPSSMGFDDPAALAEWHQRLEYVDEAPMNDSRCFGEGPFDHPPMYRLMNTMPASRRSSRHCAVPVLRNDLLTPPPADARSSRPSCGTHAVARP